MPSSNIELNHLLAVLPQEVLERWRPALQLVELRLGDVLHEPGGVQSHVYFPTTAIVSLLYILDTGASAEIAIVGNEGLVGVSLFMGGGSTIGRAVVQSAGKGYRLPAAMLLEDFKREPVLHLLLRYTQALITQTCQTAVCNRHHSLDQQLCRWLLLSLDRLQCDELVMTQELIANMLGVRREGVTDSALTPPCADRRLRAGVEASSAPRPLPRSRHSAALRRVIAIRGRRTPPDGVVAAPLP